MDYDVIFRFVKRLLKKISTVIKKICSLIKSMNKCEWRYDKEDGYYETECESNFSFVDGGPCDNDITYCHNCGNKIKVIDDEE